MEAGRRCQLAQESGESPCMSLASIFAPASRSSWMVSSLPNAEDMVVGRTIGFAQGRVQWRFSGIWQRPIHLRAVFDEELAEPPVPMKSRAIELEVVAQRLERFAFGEQEPDGTDIPVIGAPFDERHSVWVG